MARKPISGGPPKRSIHSRTTLLQITLGILLFVLYLLTMAAIKLWAYAGWTWRGFLTDAKAVSALASPLLAFATLYWMVYRRFAREETFSNSFHRWLQSRHLPLITSIVLMLNLGLTACFLTLGESDVTKPVMRFAVQCNWSYAQESLERIKKDPIRADIVDTLTRYITIHRASDNDDLKFSKTLREDRNAVNQLLKDGYDYNCLNTLSYAELSKALFFVEKDDDLLSEGVRAILARLVSNRMTTQCRGRLLAKYAELELATKNYSRARMLLELADTIERDPVARARNVANIGNSYAGQGKFSLSISHYSQAEADYPEGRRYVFYSNYGYVLMSLGDYASARDKVSHALTIKPDDWYSYLNLGLISDALNQPDDAIVSYKLVIDKTDNPDTKREAQILLGRSMELASKPFKEYIKPYLGATGHSAAPAVIAQFKSDMGKRADLYNEIGRQLEQSNTHGIEQYIQWFRRRAKQIAHQ